MTQLKSMNAEIDKFWAMEQKHADERQEAEDRGYDEGFRGYVKGFLVVEPDYCWDTFGLDIVKLIEEFKIMEAEGIAQKKVEHEAKMTQEARPQPEPENDSNEEPPARNEESQDKV